MSKRDKVKSITIANLGFPSPKDGNKGRIFINESLTRRSKALFKNVRDRQKELNWKYAWSKNGVIYARKDNEAAKKKIINEEDIIKKMTEILP